MTTSVNPSISGVPVLFLHYIFTTISLILSSLYLFLVGLDDMTTSGLQDRKTSCMEEIEIDLALGLCHPVLLLGDNLLAPVLPPKTLNWDS